MGSEHTKAWLGDVMANDRRLWIPGGTYFFTVVTYDRRPFLAGTAAVGWLRQAVREVMALYPFRIDAWVVLPDHLHAVWTLPDGDAAFSKRWSRIKAGFSRRLIASGVPTDRPDGVRQRRREHAVWQRRFWEHAIRNEDDLAAHVNYVHFNPVKHGLVADAADWPYSTIHRSIRDGVYGPGRGTTEPSPR